MPSTLDLDAAVRPVVDALLQAQARIDQRWAEIAGDPRRWRERSRLRELQRYISDQLDRALRDSAGYLDDIFPRVYADGATQVAEAVGGRFRWDQAHLQALTVVTQDTYDRLLQATAHVRDETKRVIRGLVHSAVEEKIVLGRPAVRAGTALARALESNSIAVVTYRNGARVAVGRYSQMVMRTESALAYNLGTLNHGRALGVKWWEVIDGPQCGWSYHDDGDTALGKIVTQQEAESFPIAHPQCRRTFGPRPDLDTQPVPPARDSSVTQAQTVDQANFDRAVRQQQANRRARTPRTPRTPRTART